MELQFGMVVFEGLLSLEVVFLEVASLEVQSLEVVFLGVASLELVFSAEVFSIGLRCIHYSNLQYKDKLVPNHRLPLHFEVDNRQRVQWDYQYCPKGF